MKRKQELEWEEVWSFEKKTPKSVQKLRVNENKWTEYTKKLMKENPLWKCAEAGDKCSSMIRTMGEDSYPNQITLYRSLHAHQQSIHYPRNFIFGFSVNYD